MRALASILAVAAIVIAGQSFMAKRDLTGGGTSSAPQRISTIGVEMDLNAIAQAERMYFAQYGSYASLDQLASSGMMHINSAGRDGYTYRVETSQAGFRALATHQDIPAGVIQGSQAIHYPALSVDETMQIRRGE